MNAALAGLSRPVRRLLALALLALPPLLAWSLLLAPWLEARAELVARLETARAVEARALALAARRPGLEAELVALRGALAGAEGLAGGSHALAGAELGRRLREAVARHGGSLQSLETLPEGRAGAGLVGVRARLQAEPQGLRNLLAGLETGPALVQVGALSLAPVSGRGPGLEVQIELRGLRGLEEVP